MRNCSSENQLEYAFKSHGIGITETHFRRRWIIAISLWLSSGLVV